MSQFGYHPYRGRPERKKSPLRTFLRVLLVLVLAVCACLGGIFLYLQSRVVYTADGIHIDLPFQEQNSSAYQLSEDSGPVPDLVVESVPQSDYVHAILLTADAISDGTVLRQAIAANCNAVIFDMKTEPGKLGFVSDLDTAKTAKASATDSTINDALRRVNQSKGLYTIARVSCFADTRLASADPTLALVNADGTPWTDETGTCWLDPANATVQEYLAGLCRELADLGFDEILLVNCGYPADGEQDQIQWGGIVSTAEESEDGLVHTDPGKTPKKEKVIAGFLSNLKQEMRNSGAVLSVLTDQTVAERGKNALTGQTAEDLVAYAGRIWLESAVELETETFTEEGLTEPEKNLVFVDNAAGSADHAWAWIPS